MSSFELLELFVVSFDDSVVLNGKTFDADTPIVTSMGMATIAVLNGTEKTRTIRVDAAPEDGVLAEQLRGGERPEWKQMLAQTANETAVLRAGQVQGADDFGSQLFPMHRPEPEDEPYIQADEPGMSSLWQ